jgi:hypothetical protein
MRGCGSPDYPTKRPEFGALETECETKAQPKTNHVILKDRRPGHSGRRPGLTAWFGLKSPQSDRNMRPRRR